MLKRIHNVSNSSWHGLLLIADTLSSTSDLTWLYYPLMLLLCLAPVLCGCFALVCFVFAVVCFVCVCAQWMRGQQVALLRSLLFLKLCPSCIIVLLSEPDIDSPGTCLDLTALWDKKIRKFLARVRQFRRLPL